MSKLPILFLSDSQNSISFSQGMTKIQVFQHAKQCFANSVVSGLNPSIVFRTETTKGGYGQKTVNVAPDLTALLAVYDRPERGEYLFPGHHERGHINPVAASHIFKGVCDRLKLHHVSPHSFRRTAINRMWATGFLLEEIQKISGHKSLDGLSHYLVVSETRLEEAVHCL